MARDSYAEKGSLSTAGGISFRLMPGYPKISADEQGLKATEKYLIPSDSVGAFYLESIPPPINIAGFMVVPPRRKMPGLGILATRSLSFEPQSADLPGDPLDVYADDTNANAYDADYVVTIEYDARKDLDDNADETKPETFLEVGFNAGGEFLSINATDAKVEGAPGGGTFETNADTRLPLVKAVPTLEWNLRWRFALNPNWTRIFESLGHVNDAVLAMFESAPVETVMFMGISGRQNFIWDGATADVQPWSLDFKFSQRMVKEGSTDVTWNHVYSAKKNGWVGFRNADDSKVYKTTDMLELFQQ